MPVGTKDVAFFDLDSTLADTRQRHHIIDEYVSRGEQVDWERYSMACEGDTPFPGTVRLTQVLHGAGYLVVIVTGRSVAAIQPTLRWLADHHVKYTNLIMREYGDETPNEEFKVTRIKRWMAEHRVVEPMLVVEDWPIAARDMEAQGWPVLLVNPYPEYDKPTLSMYTQAQLDEMTTANHPEVAPR
jgi:phosphoglycolate phosphatase-like HAD superfamily hydrolase